MKRRGSLLLSAALVTLLVSACGGSPEYKHWKSYYKSLGGNPSDYSEDSVKTAADGNCGHLQAGGEPGWRVDDRSVRYFAAVTAAYCPDALAPMMATISGRADGADAAVRDQSWSGLPESKSFQTPTFSSNATRDLAFAGDVASLSSWRDSGPASWVAGGANSQADFRHEVIREADAVCTAMDSNVDPNEIPLTAQLALRDTVDEAAFVVEAIAFYCPDQMQAFSRGVYNQPIPTPQVENCPGARQLRVVARMTSGKGTDEMNFEVTITNLSSFDALVETEQRLHGASEYQWDPAPYVPSWGPNDFGNELDGAVRIPAGEANTFQQHASGSYKWSGAEARVKPGQFLFLGCGYKPGERPSV